MMTFHDFYQVISSILPLYISMFIGYGSVKWWKLFSQEQCSGIRKFCSLFAVPVLSFHYITKTNLYEMNLKLFGADVLQKVIVLVVLACWYNFDPRRSIKQLVTIFSICTLPNALVLGVPIIKSMYRAKATPLVVEIVLTQSVIWHPLLLIMYEYHAYKIDSSPEFSDTHGPDVDIKTTTANRHGVAGGAFTANPWAKEVKAAPVVVGGEEDLEIHMHPEGHESSRDQPSGENEQGDVKEVPSTSTTEVIPRTECQRMSNRPTSMPSTSVMAKQIVIVVWKKIISNPNTYATFVGLVCAVILSTFQIGMPRIVRGPTSFLASASLGMGMFNMGLSMGLQPMLIPCGKVVAALTMVLRFIIGPMIMAFASLVVKLRGTIFRVSVVQAAVSQGIAPSFFAAQYNVYPETFSIGMIFGMVVALPVTLLYYNLLEIEE